MKNHDNSTNKILVVDDEIALVELFQIIFNDAGYRVRGAFNGRQALQMIREEMPDFILLDVMMPGVDGIEVCRQIRTQFQTANPCIVMYTADERPQTRAACLSAGANGLITKETPIFQLPAKIKTFQQLATP